MKATHMRTWIIPLMMLTVVACQEKSTTTGSSSSTSYTVSDDTGTSTSGSTTGSTTGGTTGSGDSSLEAWKFNAVMAGSNSNSAYSARWYPGMYPSGYSSSTYTLGDFLQLYSSNTFIFKSDQKYHLRVKVLAEPTISSSDKSAKLCYDRTTGASQNSATYPYTKLRFDVAIRDIIYTNGTYTLSDSYGSQYSGDSGVAVGSYSSVFSWDKGSYPTRNPATGNDDSSGGAALVNGIVGHVVEIKNVTSNAYCSQGYTAYCPFSTHPSTRCWRVEMQLSTDVTTNSGF